MRAPSGIDLKNRIKQILWGIFNTDWGNSNFLRFIALSNTVLSISKILRADWAIRHISLRIKGPGF